MGSVRKQKVLTLSLVVTLIRSHTYLHIFYIYLYAQAMMYMLSLSPNDVLDTKHYCTKYQTSLLMIPITTTDFYARSI
jgi:hypothetical protein